MKYKSTSILKLFLILIIPMVFLSLNSARAGENKELIKVSLSGEGGAYGKAIVVSNNRAPDIFLLKVSGLEPHTRYTVFLTENPTPGFLPAQFIGEFKTNRHGFGRLYLNTEIVNAFASSNQSLADDQGVADVPGAGAIANGANTIPLNWIRVYLAEGGGNVFGSSEDDFGGGIVLTSDQALP